MTSFSRGDVVLVKFVFADEKGAKQRPCLIVSADGYHRGRQETIVAAITSNVGRLLLGDYKIDAWRKSGLLYPSIVTGIVGPKRIHQSRAWTRQNTACCVRASGPHVI